MITPDVLGAPGVVSPVLSPSGAAVLAKAVVCTGWHVSEENFLAVAGMMRDGLVNVGESNDGFLCVYPTDVGNEYAIALGLVVADAERPWSKMFGPNYSDEDR